MVRAIVALVPLVLLVGCKHVDAPALKAVSPPNLGTSGWTAASDPETGVSIALPPGWRVGVPRVIDTASLMGGGEGSPDLGSMGGPASEMGTQLMQQDAALEKKQLARMREKEGIVLHAVDGSKPIPGEEPTRIYVKKLPNASFAKVEDAAGAEKADAHRAMEATVVKLPVGEAGRLFAKGRNRIGDEECHVSYVFVDGPDAYVLRFASTNAPDAILSIEKQVAETFRVDKKK